jgi:CheY-like chemotaxis protein/anti-sigma regulatory factor (Ser/Thr protein kinase)
MKPPVIGLHGELRASPVVLVVDDDAVNIELIRQILEPLELEVHSARGVRTAYEEILKAPPDLILLDRRLGPENGLDLLKRLNVDERFAKIPVIVQTACASPRELREGFDAGAAYYVTKPLDHDLLRSVVRGALRTVGRVRNEAPKPIAGLEYLKQATFEFRTLDDALDLAFQLGQFCPRPEVAVMGLSELMVNAVEHGNLEISYTEKSALCRANSWQEEVARRLELPTYKQRVAQIRIERRADAIRFEIRDEGPGFDWRRFTTFDPERAFDPNGRGIALAQQLAFGELRYVEPGNFVVAEVALKGTA